MSSIKVNGIEIHFDDIQQVSRSAAPILLITGLGGVGAAWGPLIPEFTPERRVILPDHRGCGRSTHTTDGLTISQLANDMAALVRSLNCGPVHVVGSSTGGAIGQLMAIEHKDTVLSLTALGSWARSDKYFRTWFRIRRNVLTDQSYEDYVDISQLLLFSPDYWRGQSPAVVKQRDNMLSGALQPKDIDLARIDMIMAHDALDRLSLVTAPTLVINAALDMICPPYLGRELADAIPGATFTLLPDVGHYSHVENPQLVHGHIAKFLTLHDSLSR